MDLKQILLKLGSRKFLTMVASIILSASILLGTSPAVATEVTVVTTNFLLAVSYIFVQGEIDKEETKGQKKVE